MFAVRLSSGRYYNSFATFKDAHTISLDNGKGKKEEAGSLQGFFWF